MFEIIWVALVTASVSGYELKSENTTPVEEEFSAKIKKFTRLSSPGVEWSSPISMATAPVQQEETPSRFERPIDSSHAVLIKNAGHPNIHLTEAEAMPWAELPPIRAATPRVSWVFMTVKSDEFAKFLEQERSKDSLRSRVDVPGVITLVKNLTNDYDNTNFVNKLNHTLLRMNLPTCADSVPLNGGSVFKTTLVLPFVLSFHKMLI